MAVLYSGIGYFCAKWSHALYFDIYLHTRQLSHVSTSLPVYSGLKRISHKRVTQSNVGRLCLGIECTCICTHTISHTSFGLDYSGSQIIVMKVKGFALLGLAGMGLSDARDCFL